ncbi:MAG: hypothetical protein II992_03265 [Lachnospiraceae bacterium]|nr:hypothetical protein [Lachnospiraceae bacterium]
MNEVIICKNCGTKLKEIDGKEKCYICGESRESLTLHQIRTQIERAKKWIYYGAYNEAKKELDILEQYQITGSTIYLLKLMMDMKVATKEELKGLSINFQENYNFQQIQKCCSEYPEDYTGGIIAEYAQNAMKNKEEVDKKEKRDSQIISCVITGFLTIVFACSVSSYPGSDLPTKFWVVWAVTLGIFFGRKKIPEKYRKIAYIVLGVIWVWFYLYWCKVAEQYSM